MVEKLSVQIELLGGAKVEQDLADVTKSFDQATKSIAALGTTGADALNSAAAAAQKFGASAPQLQQVESVIRALAARAKDSNVPFSQLAANYDNARATAGQFAKAANTAGEAIAETGKKVSSFHPQLTALSRTMAALGVPFGGLVSALSRVGPAFASIALIGGSAGALVKFAFAASETEKSLTQLQAVSGQSFENLSKLSVVFAQGGTSIKQFASEFGNLSEKIALAGQQADTRLFGPRWVKAANDIRVVTQQFNNLANGARETFDSTTTLDTKVKALLESLAEVKDPQQQFLKLADIFKNLGSAMERAQLGKALGLSPTFIATLSQGSAAIKALEVEAQRLGLTLTSGNQTALQEMAAQWNQFTGLLSAFFQKIGAAAAPALANIFGSLKQAMTGIIADFQNLPIDQAFANLGVRLAPALAAISTVLSPLMSQMGTVLGEAFVAAIAAVLSATGRQLFLDFLAALFSDIIIAKQKLQNLFGSGGSSTSSSAAQFPPNEGFAAGGLLGGRGSGTSDSNLAWVSRGEHIMPARAVAQPGVLALLEALRRSGGNLAGVLDGMGRFALGGMVPRAMPAFAGGGMVGGHLGTLTLGLPSGDSVSVRASTGVVDQLRKEAALAQVRSGGRKPSRYS